MTANRFIGTSVREHTAPIDRYPAKYPEFIGTARPINMGVPTDGIIQDTNRQTDRKTLRAVPMAVPMKTSRNPADETQSRRDRCYHRLQWVLGDRDDLPAKHRPEETVVALARMVDNARTSSQTAFDTDLRKS